jgi:hypothetical protein
VFTSLLFNSRFFCNIKQKYFIRELVALHFNSTAYFCTFINNLINRADYKIFLSVTEPVFDSLLFYILQRLINRADYKIFLSVTEPVFDSLLSTQFYHLINRADNKIFLSVTESVFDSKTRDSSRAFTSSKWTQNNSNSCCWQ